MAHILSKRAYLYIIIFFIAVFIMSLFASCGSDTVVNGNGNTGDIAIYSIDSLVLHSMRIASTDTTFNRNFNADLDSFKISFTVSSNVPNGLSELIVFFTDSLTGLYNRTFSESELNGSYSVNLFSQYAACTKYIEAHLTVNGNGNIDKFLIVKNFKVYKIN